MLFVSGIFNLPSQDRFGDKVKFRRYGAKKGLFSRFGVQFVQDAVQGIEERAAFARFGL